MSKTEGPLTSQARLRKYNYPLGHEGPAHIFKKGVMKCRQVGVSVGLGGGMRA